MVKRYAIVKDGVVVNMAIGLDALGPDWIESEAAHIGDAWDGEVFTAAPVAVPTEAEAAIAALAEIDRRSGMSRLLRETLLALAGTNAPAMLKTYETQAAAQRAKLAPK